MMDTSIRMGWRGGRTKKTEACDQKSDTAESTCVGGASQSQQLGLKETNTIDQ